jgi:hypothetical protein
MSKNVSFKTIGRGKIGRSSNGKEYIRLTITEPKENLANQDWFEGIYLFQTGMPGLYSVAAPTYNGPTRLDKLLEWAACHNEPAVFRLGEALSLLMSATTTKDLAAFDAYAQKYFVPMKEKY